MELLRKVSEFTTSIDEKRQIYILYIRSIVEQSCTVWHSSLSKENTEDLERVQKAALKIILGEKYENYEDGLVKANLESLENRREMLCRNFATKCIKSKNPRVKEIFKEKQKPEKNLRNIEKYEVNFARTNRLKNSSIPYMQRILNNVNTPDEKQKEKEINHG